MCSRRFIVGKKIVSTSSPLEDSVRADQERSEDEQIARGMQIVRWQLIVYLTLAVIGSLAFLSGRFGDFPYASF
jgi:hypothetical protein